MAFTTYQTIITGYTEERGETVVAVPDGITGIGEYAFAGRTNLKKVILPPTVRYIDECAFNGCGNLREIEIPPSVQSIGTFVFGYCRKLESIVIPDSVTEIGAEAFSECSALESVRLSANLKEIEYGTFDSCAALREIDIPCRVTRIHSTAFRDCHSLRSVTIPASVDEIEDLVFYRCENLEHITVDENNEIYDSRDNCNGIIFTHDNTLIFGCRGTVIPESVDTIGEQAFCGSGLTEFDVPGHIVSIEGGAFEDCENLRRVSIPASVRTIYDHAFISCHNLEEITVDKENPRYDSRDNCNGIILSHNNMLVITSNSTVIPDGVTEIDGGAFNNCGGPVSVTIPESVTKIGYGAFYECRNLCSVRIPASVTRIDWNSFTHCDSLKDLYLESGDLSIFSEPMLKRTAMDTFMRDFASYPEEAVEGHMTYFRRRRKTLLCDVFKNDRAQFLEYIAGQDFITKKNVDDDFLEPAQEANALQCVAFILDWKNKNITEEDRQRAYERELTKSPFNTKDMKKLWSYRKKEDGTIAITAYRGSEITADIPPIIGRTPVTEVSLYSSVINRSTNKITTQNLISVTIPDSVTVIGSGAFARCESLRNISIPSSVTVIRTGAFANCSALTEIELPDSVTATGESLFYACEMLESVKLPAGITAINNSMFMGCAGLTAFTIPDTVLKVGKEAFSQCKNLTDITIPFSVKEIADLAFFACANLREITIPPSVTKIGKNTFSTCPVLTIKCEKDSYAYRYAKRKGIAVATGE